MEKLTIQEEEVMIYIWELQCCFVKDIVAKYTQPAPPYTTVASIVKNLERKGYVTPKRVGNTYQYTPAIRENEYKRHFMSGVVRNRTLTKKWFLSLTKTRKFRPMISKILSNSLKKEKKINRKHSSP